MQATHGSAVSLRTRGRLLGCLMALALTLTALVLAPAANAAKTEGAPATTTYLALGDSISFGYSQERFDLHFPTEAPKYFEEGFTDGFAKDLRKGSEVGKSIRLVDDACPGETSNGLIGENEAIGGKKSTESIEEVEGKPAEEFPAGGYQGLGDYHPCKYTFVTHLPLHNGGYLNGGAEVSQLEEALASISSTTSPVKAITINIGSNDELAGITQCKNEVAIEFGTEGKSKYGAPPSLAVINCIKESSATVLVPHILKNLGTIISVLDGAGYKGPIILLGFYNPDTFLLPGSDELQAATNEHVEKELIPGLALEGIKNVTYANPFPVFNKGAGTNSAQEKKSICKYTEMCNAHDLEVHKEGDIHPSPAGYKALAKLVNAAYLANEAK
jgi:lysophospholipase L1-like esterase